MTYVIKVPTPPELNAIDALPNEIFIDLILFVILIYVQKRRKSKLVTQQIFIKDSIRILNITLIIKLKDGPHTHQIRQNFLGN
jgi:hypothetical protein